MKRAVLALLASGAFALPGHAQLFGPESLTCGVFGALIGGVAGGDCRHGFSGEGAAIGAGVGLLAGALIGEANRQSYYSSTVVSASPGYYYAGTVPAAQSGYGYVEAPVYQSQPVVIAAPPRPNYVVGSTAAGALTGGIIGATQGKGWEGAGIGAAAGLVVGGIAESAARKHEQRVWTQQTQALPASTPQVQQPAQRLQPAPAPQYASVANYHTMAPQVPDAPRVPDAPTF